VRISSIVALVVIAIVALFLWRAGDYLVVNNARHSDVILVLEGDPGFQRFHAGLQIMGEGYGRTMLIDASTDSAAYGRPEPEVLRNLITENAGTQREQVRLCLMPKADTALEAMRCERCLRETGAHSVVLVTSEYHTRRALSIFRQRLPQYSWSTYAVSQPTIFRKDWWSDRKAAQTVAREWAKLLYWHTWQRWQD
jgi:hypothetical protein